MNNYITDYITDLHNIQRDLQSIHKAYVRTIDKYKNSNTLAKYTNNVIQACKYYEDRLSDIKKCISLVPNYDVYTRELFKSCNDTIELLKRLG